MPDIDPAALSRSDSLTLATSSSFSSSTKAAGAAAPLSVKTGKTSSAAQRIDLEPLYASLKAAIGEHWAEYKEATSLYILGRLNQNELSLQVDHYVTADANTMHLHNQLICAIYGNITRELPDQPLAAWVSANDKPMVLSKPVSGDAAEQRLKTEVMQLPARDRRRLKEVPELDIPDAAAHLVATSMTEYHMTKHVKIPETVPASAGGLNKTNWDLEIRKRYSQPLASETGEFPDADAIQGRMIPICYEESLPNGCDRSCAEFVAIATEQYIKGVVSAVLARTRSNVPAAIGGNGIMTYRYRKQLEREKEGAEKEEIARGTGNGMLPIEVKEAGVRRGLGMGDLRLAIGIGGCGLGQMPGVVNGVMAGWEEGVLEGWGRGDGWFYGETEPGTDMNGGARTDSSDPGGNVADRSGARMNGIVNAITNGDAETEPEDSDWGWEGGLPADRAALNSLLDEVLAIRV